MLVTVLVAAGSNLNAGPYRTPLVPNITEESRETPAPKSMFIASETRNMFAPKRDAVFSSARTRVMQTRSERAVASTAFPVATVSA